MCIYIYIYIYIYILIKSHRVPRSQVAVRTHTSALNRESEQGGVELDRYLQHKDALHVSCIAVRGHVMWRKLALCSAVQCSAAQCCAVRRSVAHPLHASGDYTMI